MNAFCAHRGSGLLSRQCRHILQHIQQCGGDWSIGEIARMLAMEKSSVSARIHELLSDRLLVEYPRRKDRFSGINIRPVGLPPSQGGSFQ